MARYFPFNRGASVSRPDLDFGRAITSGLGLNFVNRAEADRYAGNIELKRLDVTGRPVQGPQLVAADIEGQTQAIEAEFGGGDFALPFQPGSGGDGISPVVLIALVGGAAFLGYTLLAK
ncbi:MAG: hypothetical protein K8953_05240 [Proteobacteria bacterium]|nr:hypothetical protein [Pseudomonadota bacterium]